MAKSEKSEGLGEMIAAGLKNILGGGETKTASTKKATAKRGRPAKTKATPKAEATPKEKAPKESLKTKFKPRDLNRVEKRSKIKKGKSGQTARGKSQDKKFIALPAGTRVASEVSMITMANGKSFARRNPRAVAGNLYTEKRKNRADVFGKVARRGGKM